MAAFLTGLLVAIVAGVFGLGGSILTGRHQHRQWLSDKRLEACSTFVAACDAISTTHTLEHMLTEVLSRRAEVVGIELVDGLPASFAETLRKEFSLVGDVDRALSDVQLLMDDATVDAAQKLKSILMTAAFEPTKHAATIVRAHGTFVRAARTSLKADR